MKNCRRLFVLLLGALFLMSGTIDLNNLSNYANQNVPSYITKDNITNNHITDAGATLGRVLFYDKKLSTNNQIACANCHKQAFAFGDNATVSVGVNGTSSRHSMRLVNIRFGEETKVTWDESVDSLEEQMTLPIKNHNEMGFSGENGSPSFEDLLLKMDSLEYYDILFDTAFGDTIITEEKIQQALAQFIRSIQSFDSKYDEGRALVNSDLEDFPNFTESENNGKKLFMGSAGCNECHRAPEFDIDPNTLGNGIVAGINEPFDPFVIRSPTLRDLINPQNNINGNLMHNGTIGTLGGIISHYKDVGNFALSDYGSLDVVDERLIQDSIPQTLAISFQQRQDLQAFLRTLSGTDMYTNPKWSNPFDANGILNLTGACFKDFIDVDQSILDSGLIQVVRNIQSNGQVIAGDTVIFKAGVSIEMTNSFEVESGAYFEAVIESCE